MPAEGAPIELDHLFPRYHLRPPAGYLNDPNGPIMIDGVLHLYFQYRLTTELDSPVLWGHATSSDGVHWEHRRPAVVPHPVGPDRDGCWSGNTVFGPDGRVHAFYSGLRADHPFQSVLRATSNDGGDSFGPPTQVVPDPDPRERIVTFRDPFVWADGERWLMAVGAGDAEGVASARLYVSDDLTEWHHLGTLAHAARTVRPGIDTGEMWECPQLLELDGRPVLLVGAWTRAHGTMAVYAIDGVRTDDGEVDPAGLRVDPADDGPDFYAASVLRDGDPAGPVVWGWLREARAYDWCEAQGWAGAISLPRVVRTGDDGGLRWFPHPALDRLRVGDPVPVGAGGVTGVPAQLELQLRRRGAGSVRVRIDFGPDEHLDLVLDGDRLEIDRSAASRDPRATGGCTVVPAPFEGDRPEIRLFLDGSTVEVFTSAGRVASLRCYPTSPPPYAVTVEGDDADVLLWSLAGHRTSTQSPFDTALAVVPLPANT